MVEESERDLAELVRLALIFTLLALDAWIVWGTVKDRPDIVVLRARVRERLAGPWRRYTEMRKAQKHVVWEAMSALEEEQEEQP